MGGLCFVVVVNAAEGEAEVRAGGLRCLGNRQDTHAHMHTQERRALNLSDQRSQDCSVIILNLCVHLFIICTI